MTSGSGVKPPYEASDDQLFRELIPELSADFVRLAVPDVARQLDLSSIEFRRCEYFSDSPRGGRPRRPDLVAEAPLLADPACKVTLHAEIEYRYLKARIPRLLDYNRLVALREGRPVHTIVVYVHGGPAGIKPGVYSETSAGRATNMLHYVSLGLTRLDAQDFLVRPEPLAWALAARMRPGSLVTPAALRLACLSRIAGDPRLTESQRFKLFNFVASWIVSDKGVSEEYDELIGRRKEVEGTMIDWAKKKQYEGYVKGLEDGVRELRSLVRSLIAQRFGSVSPKLERWISTLDTFQELAGLAKRIAIVDSPEELMLR